MNFKKLRSKIKYDPKKSGSYHKTEYYQTVQKKIKNQETIQTEKKLLKTKKKEEITELIRKYKNLLKTKSLSLAKRLKCIYKRNQEAVDKGTKIKNTHLMKLLTSLPLLVISYKKIRKNKGSMTVASILSNENYDALTPNQRNYYNKISQTPDGISREIFDLTIKLLRKEEYPWGASKRVYVEKPGSEKLRPIIIPPFMDKIIQYAIKTILEAIYEPEFDKLNCSFGFRPKKSCKDAIYSITNHQIARGLWNAMEGDIKEAYDRANRKKLKKKMETKITDKKIYESN